MAVCLNPNLIYVKIKDNSTGKIYIMMEARLETLFKKPEDFTVLEKFKGSTLEHKSIFAVVSLLRSFEGERRL